MTGRVAQDIIDWTTCVAKVGGEIDAEATAKLLVAAQERKAELQTSAMKLKSALADKEPPRRQNSESIVQVRPRVELIIRVHLLPISPIITARFPLYQLQAEPVLGHHVARVEGGRREYSPSLV
jgi:hypothetical protein